MDIRDKIPVIRVAIRGANGRMGLQAIYASMENNENILARAKTKELADTDVWIDIVFGAFTADIPYGAADSCRGHAFGKIKNPGRV